ncbi:hypothetical protein HZC33_02880 [Candidatus Wolfebacteria bacterium]|nr:hypothetical protein [Candidatus Wolfebacteria bacterium]
MATLDSDLKRLAGFSIPLDKDLFDDEEVKVERTHRQGQGGNGFVPIDLVADPNPLSNPELALIAEEEFADFIFE